MLRDLTQAFPNALPNVFITTLKMMKVMFSNATNIQNGKQRFVYLFISYILVSVSPFEWRLFTIDSCWYRQLIPLTLVQNACVSLQSAVVCAVCSSADFWSRRCRHKATTPSAFIAASSLKSAGCVLPFRCRSKPVWLSFLCETVKSSLFLGSGYLH